MTDFFRYLTCIAVGVAFGVSSIVGTTIALEWVGYGYTSTVILSVLIPLVCGIGGWVLYDEVN